MSKDAKVAGKEEIRTNNTVEKSSEVPKKIQEAWDSIVLQLNKYKEMKVRSTEMELKCIGFLECTAQMYPQLQQEEEKQEEN